MQQLESRKNLRPSIENYLRRFVLRRRRLAAMRAAALALLLATVWLLAFAVVDRFYALSATVRAVTLLALALILFRMVRTPLAAMFRRSIDWRAAAEQLEDSDPRFNEMLATIVSHSLAGHSRETSEQLVARLITATESRISVRDSRRSVPLAPAAGATAAAVFGLLFLTGLCAWAWLGLPQLLARQLLPFADIQPVTTTRLEIAPGAVSIVQGRPLTITARAAPLLGSAVLLRTSADGRVWTSAGMTPSPDGLYTFQIPSLSRDFHYRIIAGDAEAGPYRVRVLRRPLVKEFQIRLDYPAQVHRPPLSLTSTDGMIEGPVGTVADVMIIASESLKSASVLVGAQRIESIATPHPFARHVRFPILTDQRWTVEMLSEQNVAGIGPADMMIRAMPDRPPTARLTLPATASLLRPRDQLRVSYQAADDFALASLRAQIAVEGREALSIPLTIGADPRRCEDVFSVDLARCNVAIGQRVTMTLVAVDGAGQVANSTPAFILICPKAVDPYERRRLDDLEEAARIAGQIVSYLRDAPQNLNERESTAARVGRAGESAALLIRAVLRCAAGLDRPPLAAALAKIADLATVQAARIELLNNQAGGSPVDAMAAQIAAAQELATQILAMTVQLRDGVGVELALVQMENIAALAEKDDPVIEQLRREIDATLDDLKLRRDQPDIAARLEEVRIDVAARVQSSAAPHFASISARWAQSPQPQGELLSERLLTAAQIEAVRADADLVWARDLLLTSRAARTIDALMPAVGQPGSTPDLRAALVEAFSSITAEYDLRRGGQGRVAMELPEMASDRARDEASLARKRMRGWAGEAELAAGAATMAEEQASAMEANALSSQRQYDLAQAIDARLYRNAPQLRRRIESEFNRAREIDDLSRRQQSLEASAGQMAAGDAAARQRDITVRIEDVVNLSQQLPGGDDSRQQGLAALQKAQEELAILPLRLARVEQVIGLTNAARTPPAASLPAGTVPEAVAESVGRSNLEPALQAIQLSWQRDATQRILDRVSDLRRFAPETSDVVGQADAVLIPAMRGLQENLRLRDADSATRSVTQIRHGIGLVQIGMESARNALLDRDPLVAAQWFAREAATAVAAPATQSTQPSQSQAQAAAALRRAWDDSVHRLAEVRLGSSFALAPVLRLSDRESRTGDVSGGGWGRQGREGETPAIGVNDPAGFEDALRAYFRSLQGARPRATQ